MPVIIVIGAGIALVAVIKSKVALAVGLTAIGIGLVGWLQGVTDHPLEDNPSSVNVEDSDAVDLSEAPSLGWPTERDDAAPARVREGYTPDQILEPPSRPAWVSCEDYLCLAGYSGLVRLYDTFPHVSFMAVIEEQYEPPSQCRWWRSRFNPLPGCWGTDWPTDATPFDRLVMLGVEPEQAARLLTPR